MEDAKNLTESCKAFLKKTREFIKKVEEMEQEVKTWDEESLTSLKKGKNGDVLVSKILKKIHSNLLNASIKTEKFKEDLGKRIENGEKVKKERKERDGEEKNVGLEDQHNLMEGENEMGAMVEWSETLQMNGLPEELLTQSGATSPTLSQASSFDFGHSYHPGSQVAVKNNTTTTNMNGGYTPSVGTLSAVSMDDFAMDLSENDETFTKKKQKEQLPKLSIPNYHHSNASSNPKSALPAVGRSESNVGDLDSFFGDVFKNEDANQKERKPKSLTTPKSTDQSSHFQSEDRDEWDDFIDSSVKDKSPSNPVSNRTTNRDDVSINSDQSNSLLLDIEDDEDTKPKSISPKSQDKKPTKPAISPVPLNEKQERGDYNLDDFMSEPTLEDMLNPNNLGSKKPNKKSVPNGVGDNFSALDEYLGNSVSSKQPRDLLQFSSKQEQFCDNVLSLFNNK